MHLDPDLLYQLLERWPDSPRLVEARSLILRGDAEAWSSDPEMAHGVLASQVDPLAVAWGTPAEQDLDAALLTSFPGVQLLVPSDSLVHLQRLLPDWETERATLFTAPADVLATLAEPRAPEGVHLAPIRAAELAACDELDDVLRADLLHAAARTTVLAAWLDHRPAAFCYAGAVSDSWWDVSLDTLPGYRRRGLAEVLFRHLTAIERQRDRAPVWGAVDSNLASRALAQKLGLVSTDELHVMSATG